MLKILGLNMHSSIPEVNKTIKNKNGNQNLYQSCFISGVTTVNIEPVFLHVCLSGPPAYCRWSYSQDQSPGRPRTIYRGLHSAAAVTTW